MFFKVLIKIVYKISQSHNGLRTYIYLVLGHYLMYNNVFDFYTDLTNLHNGNFI